jgi:hypothetical protein
MEEYKEIIKWYKSTLIFKLSQIGYALNCNLIFSDRLQYLDMNKSFQLINYLKDGDKIFLDLGAIKNAELLDYIINTIKSLNIKLIFYLQYEPFVSQDIINKLLPLSYHIYCQNNNYSHPLVHCMPIGIRDCGTIAKSMHDNFYHSYLFNEGIKNVSKKYLCLIGGTANQTHPDRLIYYNFLKDKNFVYDISKLDFSINMTSSYGKIPVYTYYNYINQSHYVIAPFGTGVDTHRFFEIIYLKSIPIVKKTNTAFDKLYEIFPCLVINEWNDITEELLNSNLEILKIKINDFFQKYPDCYFNTNVLDDLLLLS